MQEVHGDQVIQWKLLLKILSFASGIKNDLCTCTKLCYFTTTTPCERR